MDILSVIHCENNKKRSISRCSQFMVLSLEDRMKIADTEAVLPSPRRRADLAVPLILSQTCIHPIVSHSPLATDHLNSFESISV